MLSHELAGLKRIGITATKWGSNYRVKVRNATGRQVYITKLSNPKNLRFLAKTYKVSIDRLQTHLSADFRPNPTYKKWQGTALETHL